MNLRVMNNKEIKDMYGLLESQFGCKLRLEHGFAVNAKNRVYAFNKEIFNENMSNVRLNSFGVYFAEIVDGKIRLSIEGSQIIGKYATENVIGLNDDEALRLFKGEDLEKETSCNGFVILRHDDDFLGTGKAKGNKILNFVSKSRRIYQN